MENKSHKDAETAKRHMRMSNLQRLISEADSVQRVFVEVPPLESPSARGQRKPLVMLTRGKT